MNADKPYLIIRQAIRTADIDRPLIQPGVSRAPIFRSNEEIEHLAQAVLAALQKNGLEVAETDRA